MERFFVKCLLIPTSIWLLLIPAPAGAQTGQHVMMLSALSDCIREAIDLSAAELDGDTLSLSCAGIKAKNLYNFLGDEIRSEIVVDQNGKFENRKFGNNACYHRIENPGGRGADEFRCDLFLVIGAAANGHTDQSDWESK